jgi:hypothetical protein
VDVILVKENLIQLPHIDHFPALLALVEVAFFRFAQLVKIGGIHMLALEIVFLGTLFAVCVNLRRSRVKAEKSKT